MRLSSFLRTWLATFVAFGLALALMLVSASALAAISFDATPTGGQASPADIEMVQDAGNAALNAQYVGIKFNSSIALTNVYARAVITGAGYLLDAEEAQDHFVGDLAGTFKVGYWFINHPTSGNGNFRVDIYVGDPANGGALQASSSNYLLRSSDSDNSASANKIFSVSLNGGSPIELGQSFNAVVCYTVNSNARLLIQPAVSSVFNPNNLRLGDSTTGLFASSDCSGTATATLSNQLMFNGSNNAGSVRATYTFQTIGQVSVALSPLVDAKSGIYKYNADFATFPGTTVPAPTNKVVLAKSVNTAESPGAVTVTYTLTATNTGSSTTYLDEFIDTLPSSPAAAGYVAGSSKLNGVAFGNPVITGQSLSWKDPGTKPGGQFAVPAGGTLQLSFQANIPVTSGVYTNNAIAKIGTVVIDTTLATGDNVPATAITRVGPPVLTVTKAANTPTIVNTAAGTTARYTLKVANTGTTAAGVKITDTALPAGFTYLNTVAVNTPTSASCPVAATRPTVVNPTAGATAPSWGDFSIPGGCDVSVQFDASVANTVADGTYSNSASTTTTTTPATITNFDGTPVATTVDNVTVTSAVLAVTKTTSTSNVAPGGLATYTVTVTNSGTANATGVKVTDTLPAGFAYASTTSVTLNDTAVAAAGFTAGGTAAVPAWDTNPSVGFTVNAGKTLVIVFRATASATTGTYNNSATATSINAKTITNFDGTASTAEDVTVASIILTVTKTTSTPIVVNTSTGTTATYTVTVTNSGSTNATGVKLSDTLPAGFTYASTSSVTVNGAAVLPANYLTAGTPAVPTWDTNPTGGFIINAGQTLVVTFVANVANTVGDGLYNNIAGVTSTNATNITNFDGTATTEDVLVKSAVLTVSKTTSTSVVTNTILGTTAAYTVTVTNSGTAAATGVKLTDALPAGFSYASTTSVTENGNPVTSFSVTGTTSPQWDTSPTGGFTVDPGKTLQIVFVANLASTVADGTYNNSASASSSNAKTTTNFDGAASTTDNVTVNSAVLTATKTTSTPTVVNAPTAATANYAITVTNSGGGAAPNVTVRDLLPTGFIYKGTVSVVLNGTATTAYTIDTSTANPLWAGTGVDGFVISGGQSLVITLEATVPTTLAAGVYHNGADIEGTAASVADYIATSNTTDDVTVTGPILTVTKTTSTPTVTNTASGTTATYTVTVVNSGTANATGVVLMDALPSGFSYTNGGAATVTLNGTVLATTAYSENTGNTPSWTTNPAGGFTIERGKSLRVVFTATVASTVPDGTYDNSASVTSTNATNVTNFVGSASSGENVTVTSAVLAVTKTTSTPNVTNTATGTTATYTITVANTGTANATGVKVSDMLTAGFTYASTGSVTVNGAATTAYTATGAATSVASWDTSPAGGFTINAGQNLVITFVANVSSAVAPGTYNNSASATSTNARTISNFVGANNTSDDVTVSLPTGVSLYGTAYNDANHNLQHDGGEGGTGLTLYAKLVPGAGGSALQAVAVNPTTGAYTLVTVTPGNYSIILDDNNVLTDTTPTVPGGWIGTEMPDFRRTNVQVATTDLQNLNFGLFNGGKLSGFVFADVGAGAGMANNGIKDGSEAGIAGVTVKVTNGGGTATYDSSVTSADGGYTLWIPSAAVATTLKIVETNLSGTLSTGASVGNTGGSYDRASDGITFGNVSGGIFTGVNFGDVPVNRFVANGQQSGSPGNVVFYPHQFHAGSGGAVSFNVTSASSWPVVVYRDSNCNGVVDAVENVISGAITVLAAEQICLVNKVTIPAGTALGAQDAATLQASFIYTNANPGLSATLAVIDSTTVGAGSAGLVLTKTTDKATALPGDTINYTVSYQNNSNTSIGTIVISDATPAFTTYVTTPAPSAVCIMPLPAGITACSVTTSPAPGGGTSIQWTLTGALNPASTGQVGFAVKVN